ncbi:AAA family ATPase [Methylobacterium terricola]|uniref:AAA family ATPase n=1 Tax=Methylobacterium terricola TaxID=2583531 RepID=A0A5C4LIJ2_9HYPH|nr:AAA family ATPase [Methylobacterium terricola]TNC12724.1 AAA family ATPase [Methylobacterium terricola]
MRDELKRIAEAIEGRQLPGSFAELFEGNWDEAERRFTSQETYVLDYKEEVPDRFSDGYGAGIVRLALAFHNSYGGLVVFGVKDRALTIVGARRPLDVEALNRVLSDFTGIGIECVMRRYTVAQPDGVALDIVALLVPRRGLARPARLSRPLGPYPAGMTWVRDRHEVLEAGSRHLHVLYSDRRLLPSEDDDGEATFPIHRSFPPSPATVRDFIGRRKLTEALFDWLLFDDQPRMYLHGPGGSGKSTLAFEIARLLADNGHAMTLPGGERLDYVVYLSGKETEFNSATGRQQDFALRQFGSARELMVQLLHHAGFAAQDEVAGADERTLETRLSELFDSYNGLVVIDDIDALSRRKVDTAEEALFLRAVRARRWTRILYTLRYPPANAIRSSLPVPGLDSDTEVPEFLEACCRQFEVPEPAADQVPAIIRATDCLPLLIETVIGLRRFTGNYPEAIRIFSDRGGDEARRYLYQREYDQLDPAGRSKPVLAALLLLGEPVTFATIAGLLSHLTKPQVADALSETGSVFLSTFQDEDGETLYQLVPPSVPFVRLVSERQPYFNRLINTVEHFRATGVRTTPREATLIVTMERALRDRAFGQVAEIHASMSAHDPALGNPKIRALLAQAYGELGPAHRTSAREWFRAAEAMGYRDPFMMRRWYHLEIVAGDDPSEAERLCRAVLADEKFAARHRSEFLSKLGRSLVQQANGLGAVNQDRANVLVRQACVAYLEALWVGRNLCGFDLRETLHWLERTLERMLRLSAEDAEQFFNLLEEVAAAGHDPHPDGTDVLVEYLLKVPLRSDRAWFTKLIGLCTRTAGRVARVARPADDHPGLMRLITTLEDLRANLEARRPPRERPLAAASRGS